MTGIAIFMWLLLNQSNPNITFEKGCIVGTYYDDTHAKDDIRFIYSDEDGRHRDGKIEGILREVPEGFWD